MNKDRGQERRKGVDQREGTRRDVREMRVREEMKGTEWEERDRIGKEASRGTGWEEREMTGREGRRQGKGGNRGRRQGEDIQGRKGWEQGG